MRASQARARGSGVRARARAGRTRGDPARPRHRHAKGRGRRGAGLRPRRPVLHGARSSLPIGCRRLAARSHCRRMGWPDRHLRYRRLGRPSNRHRSLRRHSRNERAGRVDGHRARRAIRRARAAGPAEAGRHIAPRTSPRRIRSRDTRRHGRSGEAAGRAHPRVSRGVGAGADAPVLGRAGRFRRRRAGAIRCGIRARQSAGMDRPQSVQAQARVESRHMGAARHHVVECRPHRRRPGGHRIVPDGGVPRSDSQGTAAGLPRHRPPLALRRGGSAAGGRRDSSRGIAGDGVWRLVFGDAD